MLVSKFSVPIIRQTWLNNLKNVLVRCASKKSCSNNIKKSCPSREKTGGRVIRSRCDENRTALVKCPKTTCKTDSPIAPSKCNSKISEVYLQSLKSVENQAKKLSSLVENSGKLILEDFETEIIHKKTEQATKRQEILKSVNDKLRKLIILDSICGIKKRNEAWMINYKVFGELMYCKCRNPEDIKFLKTEIEKLISKTKSKTNSAIDLFKSCRKCDSPNCLKDCVEEKTNEAIKILECANETVSKEITELQNYKTTAVKNFSVALEKITESYGTRIEKFSENLSRSIHYIKKQGNVKRKCK